MAREIQLSSPFLFFKKNVNSNLGLHEPSLLSEVN